MEGDATTKITFTVFDIVMAYDNRHPSAVIRDEVGKTAKGAIRWLCFMCTNHDNEQR